ncbi:LysM peptidoglycan-binding domain-containing protein [Mesorhizobium sp. LSJC269B00]|uniref:CIS tube protein n=1 Tax=Mesorhizobium sp. LSJC269B00 TaxID=1287326 RepID=UPI0003F5E7C3|nr:LysM peptidoglycan-binding domain-containing protein [Mesorhizobium sp. LSJC269B00]
MTIVKTIIEIAEEDQAAARSAGLPTRFSAQFNPTEYSLERGANFAEIAIPGLEEPILQFIHGNSQRLSLELLLDASKIDSAVDVAALANDLQRLARILPERHAPPRLKIIWGTHLALKAIAENVQCRFTLFSESGEPIRARVTLALRSYRTLGEQLRELNLQSPDHSKTHCVRSGDSLALIAYQAYGNHALWREIADANPEAIADPLRLVPGTMLKIRPLANPSRSRPS